MSEVSYQRGDVAQATGLGVYDAILANLPFTKGAAYPILRVIAPLATPETLVALLLPSRFMHHATFQTWRETWGFALPIVCAAIGRVPFESGVSFEADGSGKHDVSLFFLHKLRDGEAMPETRLTTVNVAAAKAAYASNGLPELTPRRQLNLFE
jgi:hypothetical protein